MIIYTDLMTNEEVEIWNVLHVLGDASTTLINF